MKNVVVFDFSSMYPSVVLEYSIDLNFSFDLVDENGDVVFEKKEINQSVLPYCMQHFLSCRIKAKKEKDDIS